MNTTLPVARAYDAIASEYEAQLERDPVARYMRKELHAHLASIFFSGDSVLDLTAGTGIDARLLASRGVQVSAVDASAGMIGELVRRAREEGKSIDARVLAAERIAEAGLSGLDGALSTFGGLNTIEDMPQLAQDLHRCLKPGGRVILHALNDFCLWQWAISRRSKTSRQRFGGWNQAPNFRLYNPLALWRTAFRPYFDLREVYALSVLTPPALVRRLPAGAGPLFAIDRLVGRVLWQAGDFFVLDLERRG